jgi:hypothetical protein
MATYATLTAKLAHVDITASELSEDAVVALAGVLDDAVRLLVGMPASVADRLNDKQRIAIVETWTEWAKGQADV